LKDSSLVLKIPFQWVNYPACHPFIIWQFSSFIKSLGEGSLPLPCTHLCEICGHHCCSQAQPQSHTTWQLSCWGRDCCSSPHPNILEVLLGGGEITETQQQDGAVWARLLCLLMNSLPQWSTYVCNSWRTKYPSSKTCIKCRLDGKQTGSQVSAYQNRDSDSECRIAHRVFRLAAFKSSPAHWHSLGFSGWGHGCSRLDTCSCDLLTRQHKDSLCRTPQTPSSLLLGEQSTSVCSLQCQELAQQMCMLGSGGKARIWNYPGKDIEPHCKAPLVSGLSNESDTEELIICYSKSTKEKKMSPPCHPPFLRYNFKSKEEDTQRISFC